MSIFSRLFDALIQRRLRKSGRPLGWSSPRAIACWSCEISHTLPTDLRQALASAEGFISRHREHKVDWHEAPGLAGLWTPNADVKTAYGSSAAYTITLASLANSGTLVAGQESTAVSNTSNLYDDYMIGGKITTGTSPVAESQIEIDVYGSYADAPTYPGGITGSNSARTFASVNVKRGCVRLVERLFVDSTNNTAYAFGPVFIKQAFGGNIPKNHGVWVANATNVALNATGSNHEIITTGCYQTVI